MSFWFLLWLLISAALVYFLGWTLWVLYRQKTQWKDFARRHKLRYLPGPLMQSPQVQGLFEGYQIHLFPSEHQSPDARGFRKLTAVEVGMKSALPFETAAANSGMQPVLNLLPFNRETRPKVANWATENVIRSDNPGAAEAYFTDDRLKALQKMMNVKNAMVIFLHRKETGILRIDLPDPLDNADKVERLLKNLVHVMKKLELQPGEDARLQKTSRAAESAQLVLDEKDETAGLTLEDED